MISEMSDLIVDRSFDHRDRLGHLEDAVMSDLYPCLPYIRRIFAAKLTRIRVKLECRIVVNNVQKTVRLLDYKLVCLDRLRLKRRRRRLLYLRRA